jgi:hypothetical protein
MLARVSFSVARPLSPALVPDGTPQSEQLRLLAIFDCDQQDRLAHVVYTMTAFREHCLSLPHGSPIAITNVQQIVEEDVELTRIQ